MKSKVLALGLSGWFSLVVFAPADARACGGCFHGEPATATQSPSMVTDHRMVLAITPTMTTLWDQVEYAGDPEEFAWVLPIRGKVVVGLGSDSFISSLDVGTQPLVRAPRSSCAPSWGFDEGGSGGGCGGGFSSSDDMAAPANSSPSDASGLGWQDDSGVFVTDRSTVGPYETVQVHGSDAGGIIGWLRRNKYVVPVELEPMLQKYVTDGFDFVAVRLRPGLGVHAMRPIRVSFKGAYPTLPLRMVAAGVGEKVGLKLFVVGSGRWKTANFPTLAIDPQMVTWDFNARSSDYMLVRDRESQKFDGRAWTLESSIDLARSQITIGSEPKAPEPADTGTTALDTGVTDSAVRDGETGGDADAASDAADAAPEAADAPLADTAVVDTALDASLDTASSDSTADAEPTADARPEYDAGDKPGVDPQASDLEVAYGTTSFRRVTRLRADLPSKFLDVDLVLEADENQAELPRALQVTKAINENCPPPRETSSRDSDGCDCTVVEPRRDLHLSLGVCAAAVAVAVIRRRRSNGRGVRR